MDNSLDIIKIVFATTITGLILMLTIDNKINNVMANLIKKLKKFSK